MYVKNKTIVVTGGGNGVGRELVLNLLSRGARVAAVDINESALSGTIELAGDKTGNLFCYVTDITDKEAVEIFSIKVIKQFGQIDGLINNAGIIQPFVRINNLDYSTIEKVVNVDFYGTLYMIKAFLPHFLKHPESHIVNISSMGGLFPVPGESVYGAAKAAVTMLSEGLRAELRNKNVNVTLIFPGGIETDIKFNSGAEKIKKGENDAKSAIIKPVKPKKAAQIIIDSMEKNKFRVFIGSDIKVLKFLFNVCPGFAASLINKQMKSHIPE